MVDLRVLGGQGDSPSRVIAVTEQKLLFGHGRAEQRFDIGPRIGRHADVLERGLDQLLGRHAKPSITA
jgi:hypothetical protein